MRLFVSGDMACGGCRTNAGYFFAAAMLFRWMVVAEMAPDISLPCSAFVLLEQGCQSLLCTLLLAPLLGVSTPFARSL